MAPKGRSMGKMNASARHLTSPPSVLLFYRSSRGCSNACCLPQISVLSAGEQWLSLDNYPAVIRRLQLHTLGELILYSLETSCPSQTAPLCNISYAGQKEDLGLKLRRNTGE
jgi:hypothetical protein